MIGFHRHPLIFIQNLTGDALFMLLVIVVDFDDLFGMRFEFVLKKTKTKQKKCIIKLDWMKNASFVGVDVFMIL